MNIRDLSPDFAVTGQISESDLDHAARLGFRSIIDNRPDGEGPEQPPSSEIEIAAIKLGLGFAYIPIKPGQECDYEALELAHLLETMEKPILAYCRSGARSEALWDKAQGHPHTLPKPAAQ